ncbi:MAG: hypothetical protein HLX50_11775 [Alteromonadaceae bacterium]|nr:hypothetical protein [Alteromonadaceae bacterium]
MMANSFLIVIGQPMALSGQSPAYHDASVELYTRQLNPNFMQTEFGDGFRVFLGECHPLKNQHTRAEIQPAGTRIHFSARDRVLSVESDRLGTAMVYWKQEQHRVLLSNRKENLLTQTDTIDWPSVQQYLHTGYTVNRATFFNDIHQTEPDTRLIIRAETSQTAHLEITSERISTGLLEEANQPANVLLADIADCLLNKLSATPKSVIMMSAGWDSRTLLLGGSDNLAGAYTHGDLSSREVELARKLTGRQRLDHLFVDVRQSPITVELIEQMLEELGSAVFPIWFLAARNIRQWKNAPIMSGVLGELLGGHYGLMSWGSRAHKLSASMLLFSDRLISEHHIRQGIERYCTPPASHWFVSSQGQTMLDTYRNETRQRTTNAIEEHYRIFGDWQQALENFNMHHRARQYILKQAHAASGSVGYTLPFANSKLVDLTRGLPFTERVHNRANQKILKANKPALLNESMAATLVPARYPILIQELSRAARIARETASKMPGKQKPGLGWFNYDHLYEGRLLHDLIDSLEADIWDKNRMHAAVEANPANGIDAGSTLDMICKIKTVDHYLNRSATVQGMQP